MKKIHLLLSGFFVLVGNAQDALYNSGAIQIHEAGKMGFHTNLINDGSFDENKGLVGFYGNLPLEVSGAFAATFYDLEIANDDKVVLNTSLNTSNFVNFISGDFSSARTSSDNYLNFLQNADYDGAVNLSKVDGYVAINNQQNFTFPVGDAVQLRPLILRSTDVNGFAKCAYFSEDPNRPTSIFASFSTDRKAESIGAISTAEFWSLEGSMLSTIRISWNERSNIGALVEKVNKLAIVGWSKVNSRWETISSSTAVGDLNEGFISSISFIPDAYEIITFADGFSREIDQLISTDNYLVTPNGDGVNDALEIPEIDLSPNNTLQIYDRYGLKVFEIQNYTNTEFRGFATTNNFVASKEKGLPSGVYFYVLSLEDLDLDFQGFLYLAQ